MVKVPVHIVSGWLGAGKTTTVRRWMASRAGVERCAVVVNDFGEARIDATLLDGAASVTDIPGGCVCCTAPEGLVRTIDALLDEVRPDRIFIEPSGLARPQDVVDMLTRGGLAARVELRPTLVLVDPAMLPGDDTLREQIEAADILVANRCDLATPTQMAAFRALEPWPPPLAIHETSHGVLPDDALAPGPARAGGPHDDEHGHDHDHGHVARSWVFPPGMRFSFDAVRTLVVDTPGVARFKGLFHGDIGWFRLDLAGGRLHVAGTGYRRDSRADVILEVDTSFPLEMCQLAEAPVSDEPVVALVDADGFEVRLTRAALGALPGQVPDVGVLVPGRRGSGVPLREVFALAASAGRFVVSAGDGMNTAPAAMANAGDAVLVHTLAGEPLPDSQGGPFRVLAAAGSACANVKGVVRVRLLPG